jgi:hypothetical protein
MAQLNSQQDKFQLMNALNHLFFALLVPLVNCGLHLLGLAHALARIDDLELPFRKCFIRKSTYWFFVSCSEVQFEHISSEDCVKIKHFVKFAFMDHNNCVKVCLLDFP